MDGPVGTASLAERIAREQRTVFSRANNLDCEIELESAVYYDGDLVRGEVSINALEDGIYRNVLVLLLCRFIGRDPSLAPRERCTTLHLSKFPLAAEMHIPQGLTKVPFEFAIPENVPPTFSSKWGDVVWMARLLHENPESKVRMPLATLAKTLFEKRSIYYPLPGYEPTAQGERRIFRSGQILRVEAKLAKDVHSPGEAVEVSVVLHQTVSSTAKKLPKLAIKKIKAEIVQTIDSQKSGRKQVNKSYVLETTKHCVAAWPMSESSGSTGLLTERSFSMRPAPDARLKCAHQTFLNAKLDEHQTVLAPTCKLHNAQTNSGLEVKYSVVLKLSISGASDMTIHLPFVIESPRPNSTPEIGHADDNLRDRLVFPIIDEPPEYHHHNALSVPSYTSLRRHSWDSVYVSPSMLDVTDELIPSYKDAVEACFLVEPDPKRRGKNSVGRRRTTASLASLRSGFQDAHDTRSRRNSLAGLTLWRRRSSAEGRSRSVFANATPPIADADEGVKDEAVLDQLAMLKLKYSNVRDRSNPHGPHAMSEAELRALPSDHTLDASLH